MSAVSLLTSLRVAALALVFALSAPYAHADDRAQNCHSAVDGADCLVVVVDHLVRVKLDGEAKSVLIGNPLIADINMIGKSDAVVTARTIGSTNLIFVDAEGETIGDYEVIVREAEDRRVVLREGPKNVSLFQCAPRCERTLTQLDSENAHSELSARLSREAQMNDAAANDGSAVAPAE